MKTLKEEFRQLSNVVAEIQDKVIEICINTEASKHPVEGMQVVKSSWNGVYFSADVGPSICTIPFRLFM